MIFHTYLRRLGDREELRLLFLGLLLRFLGDLERDLEPDFDLEWPLAEEDDDDEASSSWWAEFPFRGFSAMWSGRFLTASDMAASAPLATVGRGRRGSRSGSDSGSGSGSGEDGSASAGTLHKREMQTTMKYM